MKTTTAVAAVVPAPVYADWKCKNKNLLGGCFVTAALMLGVSHGALAAGPEYGTRICNGTNLDRIHYYIEPTRQQAQNTQNGHSVERGRCQNYPNGDDGWINFDYALGDAQYYRTYHLFSGTHEFYMAGNGEIDLRPYD